MKEGDKIAGLTIKKIKTGSNGKYAIIGRSMGNSSTVGVRDAFNELKQNAQVEIFDNISLTGLWKDRFEDAMDEFARATNNWTKRLTNQELMQLKMYKLNKEWAEKLKSEGFTVLDLGDFNNLGFSVFYAMEKSIIFN